MNKEQEKHDSEIWRKGYDLGVKQALQSNDEALQIGRAILAVLDDRYQFKEEDY